MQGLFKIRGFIIMKILYQNREFTILEVEQVGDRLPDFIMVKVNDFSKTYRVNQDLEKKYEKAVHIIENMVKSFDESRKILSDRTNYDHAELIDQALAYLEIYKDYDIERDLK